jgi:hypothetical protein
MCLAVLLQALHFLPFLRLILIWLCGLQLEAAESTRGSFGYFLISYATNGSTSTSNTFGMSEHYFINYAGSTNKIVSDFSVSEGNSSTYPGIAATAGLWRNTNAITSISFTPSGAVNGFVSGSSFYLYGIKNT